MSRSLKKGPYIDPRLLQKVKNAPADFHGTFKTWARASQIPPEFVGKTFEVHNGRNFIKIFITEDMVGHRLGEFSPTRTFKGHPLKKAVATTAA